METKKKNKKPVDMAQRSRIVHFVNALFGIIILMIGFICLFANTLVEKQDLVPRVELLLMSFYFLIMALIEGNSIFIRKTKSDLILSLSFAGFYLLLAIVSFFGAVYETNDLVWSTVIMCIFSAIFFGRRIVHRFRTRESTPRFVMGVLALILLFAGVFTLSIVSKTVTAFYSYTSIVFLGCGLFYILYSVFGGINPRHFLQVLNRTHAFGILSGLLLLMVATSISLIFIEDEFPTFGDALWYCFASVTTIGFGDFTAKTLLGRILTVALGIYGIVVTALITSIIVNLYNDNKETGFEAKDDSAVNEKDNAKEAEISAPPLNGDDDKSNGKAK